MEKPDLGVHAGHVELSLDLPGEKEMPHVGRGDKVMPTGENLENPPNNKEENRFEAAQPPAAHEVPEAPEGDPPARADLSEDAAKLRAAVFARGGWDAAPHAAPGAGEIDDESDDEEIMLIDDDHDLDAALAPEPEAPAAAPGGLIAATAARARAAGRAFMGLFRRG